MNELEKKNKELLEEIEKLKRQNKTLKSRKKYGLVWEEEKEPEQIVLDCQVKVPILKEVKSKKIITDKGKPVNVLIEGDNYHALSVLNYTHRGKIDVIYIDPPYNTGQGFKFNDKIVEKEDEYKHTKWLSFMKNRLSLSRNLLTANGIIFISIDENEVAQLKLLCDEIFGEDKLEGIIHWRKNRKPHNAGETISKSAEFILVYANKDKIKLVQEYTIKDSDENGNYSEGPIFKADKKERIYDFPKGIVCRTEKIKKGINTSARNPKLYIEYLDQPIIKKGILQNTIRIKGRYCLTNERGKLYEEIKQGNIFINKNGVPKCRVYREELLGKVANNLWTDKGYNEDAHEEIRNIFHVDLASEIFDYPKPVRLIKEVLKSIDNKNAIVLDFFAGSGTTGHATLDLNQEDEGKRVFILCTNNENNLCTNVCYPRIERVIKGYKNLKDEKITGLGGNLGYFKTELLDIDHISHVSDEQKIKLTYRAGDMIALREGTFEEVEKDEWWQIFKDGTKYTAIYFKEDKKKLNELVKKLSKLKEKVILYIFSWGKNEYKNEFTEYKNIKVEDIPEPIIDVYKEVNRLS